MSERDRREHFGVTYNPDRNPRVFVESMSTIGDVDVPGVEILSRKQDKWIGEAWLVRLAKPVEGVTYFVISGIPTDNGWSCLAFPATVHGVPKGFEPVAGGSTVSHKGVIEELADKMNYETQD